MAKRCILIMLDGLGDRAHDTLGGKTPLEAASTPTLDRFAAAGSNGLFHAGILGQPLPSEDAHFSIFGYTAEEFPGRGALEALGAGVSLQPDEVAVLIHGACVAPESGRLVLRRGMPKASGEEAQALIEPVSSFESRGIGFRLHRTKGLLGVLVLSGDVAREITDSDPIQEGRTIPAVRPWQEREDDPVARNTAAALTDYLRWSHRVLSEHPVNAGRIARGASPVNFMVTQRAGQLKRVPAFADRFGLRAASISSGLIYWGLGSFLGFDIHKVSDTDDPGDDLAERLRMAIGLDREFIHVHTKAPDEAGHSRDPHRKKWVIESLDRGLASVADRLLGDRDLLVAVTADHSTPSSGSLIHSGESVPLTLCGDGLRQDLVTRYSEIDAAGGALGCVRGNEFMHLVLNHLDRAKLAGLRDTPLDQPFWPGDVEPFTLEDQHGAT